MKQLMILFAASMIAAAAPPASQPTTSQPANTKPRASVDGVPFPVADVRKVDLGNLPLIKNQLGELPENISRKVHHTKTSAALLKKHKLNVSTEWFALDLNGADVVGFDLKNGRVCKLEYVFTTSAKSKMRGLHKELERAADREIDEGFGRWGIATRDFPVIYAVERWKRNKDGSISPPNGPLLGGNGLEYNYARLTIAPDPKDWVLLYDKLDEKIAAAIREKRPEIGMTLDQLKLLFGEPTGSSRDGTDQSYRWIIERQVNFHGSGRIITETERIVSATIHDGKVTSFTDDKF